MADQTFRAIVTFTVSKDDGAHTEAGVKQALKRALTSFALKKGTREVPATLARIEIFDETEKK